MMKRTLALLLCLCLLASAVISFSSCKKTSPEIDLSQYQLVYADDFAGAFLTRVNDFYRAAKAATGVTLRTFSETTTTGDYEVLIGNTNRPETAALLKKVKGDGYAYGFVENKIVIVGTSPVLTVLAIEDFIERYFKVTDGSKGPTIVIEETVVSKVPMVEIGTDYTVVYSEDWDDVSNPLSGDGAYRVTNPGENPEAWDFGVVMAHKVLETLTAVTGGEGKIGTDTNEREQEILVGLVNREETDRFIRSIAVTEYGFSLIGNKVVVTGLNDAGLRAATVMFRSVASAAAETVDGRSVIRLPEGFSWVAEMATDWVVDIPRPEGEGIYLTGSADVGEGSFEFYYTGEGITADAFGAYCTKLESEGYELLASHNPAGNQFRTYINRQRKFKLHVTYAPFAHAKEQGVGFHEPCIRIVTAESNRVGNNYSEDLLSPTYNYTKVTDSRLTAVRLTYSADVYGNCFVVQLEDGSFFVQDGGFSGGGDYERLYHVLCDLFEKAFGEQPSRANPIVIAGWYLSHGHGDHFGNFVELCKTYGTVIRVEHMIANMPSEEESYNAYDHNLTLYDRSHITKYVQGPMTYVKVHSGQRLYLRNMEIEVLYTHEDLYPRTVEFFNNSSTILRTTLHNTDGHGNRQGKATTILWLGDVMTRGSACTRAMYGDYLEADIVQVAHHGGSGAEWELYRLTQAKIVLWPCSALQVIQRAGSSSARPGTYKYVSNKVYTMSSVQYHIASDMYNTTITFTKDGPDMTIGGATGLYNAAGSEEIAFSDRGAVVKRK